MAGQKKPTNRSEREHPDNDAILALAESERGKRNVREASASARESLERFRKAKRLYSNLDQCLVARQKL